LPQNLLYPLCALFLEDVIKGFTPFLIFYFLQLLRCLLFFVTHNLLTPFANPSGEAIITATTSFLAYTIFLCLAALPSRSGNLCLPAGNAVGGCQTEPKKIICLN
jgi:hypothetical protein